MKAMKTMETKTTLTLLTTLLLTLCFALTLALLCFARPTHAASITLDLDNLDYTESSGYTFVGDYAIWIEGEGNTVTIKGDARNNPVYGGWSILVYGTSEVYIESGTILQKEDYSPSNAVLWLQRGGKVTGLGENIIINGHIAALYGDLEIDGTLDTVYGYVAAPQGNLTISGAIGSIITDTIALNAQNINISGTIGAIDSQNRGILAMENLTISGTVGSIVGADYFGIAARNSIAISGTVGTITGGVGGIGTETGDLTLTSGDVLYTSSVVSFSVDGTDIEIHPPKINANSQGIIFNGNSGTVYGNVTLQASLTIESGQALTVPSGAVLTVPNGITLTNHGTVTNQGTINGTISGNGVTVGVVVDLDNLDYTGDSGYTINTTYHRIIIDGTTPVTIKGNGTNNGDGYSILINNATEIFIEANTTLQSSIYGNAIFLSQPATITGLGENITFGGSFRGISSNSNLTINGTIDTISGISSFDNIEILGTIGTVSGYGISSTVGNVQISGTINKITAENDVGISATNGDVVIMGTVGDISGFYGIAAGYNILIAGTVGTINAEEYGIYAWDNVEISGTVGTISGGYAGIATVDGEVEILANSVIYTSSIMRIDDDWSKPEISYTPIQPASTSQGIVFIGDNGTVYGNVTLQADLTIESNQTLTIPQGAKLTIPNGITLTNHGTIINHGTIANNGTFTNHGTLTNLAEINGDIGGNGSIVGVVIDLDDLDYTGGSGYTINTDRNEINTDTTSPIIIKGDGTDGGNGWAIFLPNSPHITLEAGTTLLAPSRNTIYTDALIVNPNATIHGNGAGITITGVTSAIATVYSDTISGHLTISGTIDLLSATNVGGVGYGIFSNAETLTISGTIWKIETEGIGSGIYTRGSTLKIADNAFVHTSAGVSYLTDVDGVQGILFDADRGTVYGNAALRRDLTIAIYETLTIPEGAVLTIPNGMTLTIIGTLINNGKIINNGTINDQSGITGTGEVTGNPYEPGAPKPVILDLDNLDMSRESGYTVYTAYDAGLIEVLVHGIGPVTIKGNNTNNGNGWIIMVEHSTNIIIENNTSLVGTDMAMSPVIYAPHGAVVTGMGHDIYIEGIWGHGDLTLAGTFGEIKHMAAISAYQGNLSITGTIGKINANRAMNAINVSISGTIGGIDSQEAIFATEDITISGKIGDINNDMYSEVAIYSENGTVTISGEVGDIGYPTSPPAINAPAVTISGTVGKIYGRILLNREGVSMEDPDYVPIYVPAGIITYDFTLANNSVMYADVVTFLDGDWNSSPLQPSANSQGMLFSGGEDFPEGWLYGNMTLQRDLTIQKDQTLTIPRGTSLTIPNGVTLTNNGIIYNYGTIYSREGGIIGTGRIIGNEVVIVRDDVGGSGGGGGGVIGVLPNVPVVPIGDNGANAVVTPNGEGLGTTGTGTENPIFGNVVPPSMGIFSDTPTNAWYYNAVAFVTARGLFHGYGNGIFAPNDSMTRAMFVTVLHNLEGRPAPSGQARFTDVAVTAWEHDSVQWAAENGIVSGIGGGLYAPSQAITRQEMAVMLSNYADYKGVGLPALRDMPSFADSADIAEWARTAVERLARAGVISGDNNLIMPRKEASRAEVAQVFMNFVGFLD